MYPRPAGVVTLTTDFGVRDPYVGIMKGALLKAAPKAQVVDLSHAVPPQDVAAGAFVLWSALQRFPDGTVHVGVVDPGVGTDRRLVAVAARSQYWLAPDNGLLGAVLAAAPDAEVRELDLDHLGVVREAVTFDGRDCFAPVAGMLCAGRYGFRALGARVDDVERGDMVFSGGDRVVHVDGFGNLVTNVPGARAGATSIEVGGRTVLVQRTYSDVAAGALVGYVGSFGLVEVAAREGSAAASLGIGVGAAVVVSED
jgi:S-adenosylmethionine hydrolase